MESWSGWDCEIPSARWMEDIWNGVVEEGIPIWGYRYPFLALERPTDHTRQVGDARCGGPVGDRIPQVEFGQRLGGRGDVPLH